MTDSTNVTEATPSGATVRVRPGHSSVMPSGSLAELLEVRGSSALIKTGHDVEAWCAAAALEVVTNPHDDLAGNIRKLVTHYTTASHNAAIRACAELCERMAAMPECPPDGKEVALMLADWMRKLTLDGDA